MPKVVPLSKPITGHKGPVSQVTLRDPVFRDLLAVGAEPETIVYTGGGAFFVQENLEAIEKYLDRLIVETDVAAQIGSLDLRDAIAVRKAVVDFFREASGSASKPTNSSSPSDGTPDPSAT